MEGEEINTAQHRAQIAFHDLPPFLFPDTQIAILYELGFTKKQIAQQLETSTGIRSSIKRILESIKNIYNEIGVNNRMELFRALLEHYPKLIYQEAQSRGILIIKNKPLSPEDSRIAILAALGLTYKEIAIELGMVKEGEDLIKVVMQIDKRVRTILKRLAINNLEELKNILFQCQVRDKDEIS